MLRKRPDGSDLTWKVATMSRFDEPDRAPKPFFISWDDPAKRPDKVSIIPSAVGLVQANAEKRPDGNTLHVRTMVTVPRFDEPDRSPKPYSSLGATLPSAQKK